MGIGYMTWNTGLETRMFAVVVVVVVVGGGGGDVTIVDKQESLCSYSTIINSESR